MLQRLTNHVPLPSTTHRVVNPTGARVNRPRYSMPFFLHFNSDFPIATLPGCITPDNPDRYPQPILADDYLRGAAARNQAALLVAKLYFYYSTMNAGKSTSLLQSSHSTANAECARWYYTAAVDQRGRRQGALAHRSFERGPAVHAGIRPLRRHTPREHAGQGRQLRPTRRGAVPRRATRSNNLRESWTSCRSRYFVMDFGRTSVANCFRAAHACWRWLTS